MVLSIPVTATDVYLGLGANLGDPRGMFDRAVDLIRKEVGSVKGISRYYDTSPLNPPELEKCSQPDFLNGALHCLTSLEPMALLNAAQSIEKQLGLDRSEKQYYGPRIIDVDILFFGEETVNADGLSIPHPEIQNRDFVLVPLMDLDPNLLHPTLNKTVSDLYDELLTSGAELFIQGEPLPAPSQPAVSL